MKKCKSGRIIKRKKNKKEFYYLRLNLVDLSTLDTKKRYSVKDIETNLEVSKRNFQKANALLENAIYSFVDNTVEANLEEKTQETDEPEMRSLETQNQELFFHKYCGIWLERKSPSLEITTYEGYRYKLGIISTYFEKQSILLSELSAEDVSQFYRYLLTAERKNGRQQKIGYSNRTIKDIGVLMRSILNDAQTFHYINENPAANVKVPRTIENIKQKAYVGIEDVETFLNVIKGHRLELPLTLCLYFGLRREEVLGLKWSAIHKNGKLYIEHTVARVNTVVRKDRVKTSASYRYYPLSEPLMERLIVVRKQQLLNRERLGKDFYNSDYIFTWEDGRPYRPDYLTKAFKKIVKKSAELDDSLTLHSLRASCVSILIHSGVDIKDVQEWVGHRDIQTTMNIYARTNEKQKKEAEAKMYQTFFKDEEKMFEFVKNS